jgi:hypothetical protein
VFRELLQNSDDAEAKAVEIRFQSKATFEGISGDDPIYDREASVKDVRADLKKAIVNLYYMLPALSVDLTI